MALHAAYADMAVSAIHLARCAGTTTDGQRCRRRFWRVQHTDPVTCWQHTEEASDGAR